MLIKNKENEEEVKMKTLKSSVALLLSAALIVSAVPGELSAASVAGTPAPSEPAVTNGPASTSEPVATSAPTSTPEVKMEKPKVPKLSVKGGAGKFTVICKKVGNASGYRLRYRVGKKRWQVSSCPFVKGSMKHIQMASKGKYTVQVSAYNSYNGKRVYSSWSKAKKVTVKKAKTTKNPGMNYDET